MGKKINLDIGVRGADKAKKQLGGVDGKLKSLGQSAMAAAGGFFAARGLLNAFKAVVDAAAQQELAEKKLNAVLLSTKHVAGITAVELKNLAAELQSMTGIGDESIIRAQSLMLTFTKIGKDVFPQAIETVLNMSVAMGTDMTSSVVQLGKALNDPITGISALSRVGVQLTEDQKEQIQSFMEVNDVASAQKVILGELETQFGGLAKAAGDTMKGSIDKMNAAVGDASESIGELLSPSIIQAAGYIETVSKRVEKFFDGLIKIRSVAISVGTEIRERAIDYFDLRDAIGEATKELTIQQRVVAFGEQMQKIQAQIALVDAGVEAQKKGITENQNLFALLFGELTGANEAARTFLDTSGEVQKAGLQIAMQKLAEEAERAGVSLDLVEAVTKKTNEEDVEQLEIRRQSVGLLTNQQLQLLEVEDRNAKAREKTAKEKEKLVIQELKQAALVQGSATDAMKAVVRAESMEAVAGYIASVLKSVPYPFNVVLAAGGGAVAAGLIDKGLSSFAQGGDFITSGPQMMLVGDNPGGRERVQVEPLSSPNISGPKGGITLNISAPLVDETVIDTIIPAIEKAQRNNLA